MADQAVFPLITHWLRDLFDTSRPNNTGYAGLVMDMLPSILGGDRPLMPSFLEHGPVFVGHFPRI